MLTNLGDFIVIGEEDGKDGASANQVLDFKRVDVGVVSRFVIVEH